MTASPRRESAIIQAPAPDDFKFPNEESLRAKQQIHLAGVEPLVGTALLDASQSVQGKLLIHPSSKAMPVLIAGTVGVQEGS